MGPLIDISPVLSPRVAVWPGDVAFSRDISVSFAGGGNLDLSAIRTTLHVGAHTDGPSHYAAGAPGIDARPLETYFGPCEVLRVHIGRGERIFPRHFPSEPRCRRILLCTGTFPDPDRFDTDFAALSAELVDWLADFGVILVGIDTPSVDLYADKALEAHSAIHRRDLAILEGIVLDHVEPGIYRLIAFPLRIEGADASPVRAVLQAMG